MNDRMVIACAIFSLVLLVFVALIFKPSLAAVPLFVDMAKTVVGGGAVAVLGFYFVMSHKDPTP